MADLPRSVITEDRKLDHAKEGAAEALMKLRWHWTMDVNNPRRVSIREYARQVEKSQRVVQVDVKAYEMVMADGGTPVSATDARELARMSAETAAATEAVAKARGIGVGTARQHHGPTVRRVREKAREKAEVKGTPVAEQIKPAMESVLKGERAEQRSRDFDRRWPLWWLEIRGELTKARMSLTEAVEKARDAELTDEMAEFVQDQIEKMRAALGLAEVAVSGQTNVDWDAELAKLGG